MEGEALQVRASYLNQGKLLTTTTPHFSFFGDEDKYGKFHNVWRILWISKDVQSTPT